MLWWLTVEMLLAAVIVWITCRMRRYWLGGALLFALWPLFCWMVPMTGSEASAMFALPFVFGLPTIVVWRGRALPPEEKARIAEKYAYLNEPCPVAAFIFGVLSVVMLLWMASSWEIYDLSDGQLSVERRTWWGLKAKRKAWPTDQIAKVEVKLRKKRIRTSEKTVYDLVFLGADGTQLFRSARSVWSAYDYARQLNDELGRSKQGAFRGWTLVYREDWQFLFFFLLMTWLSSRGRSSRRKKPKRTRVVPSSPNGISLGSVLTQARPVRRNI